MTCNRPNTPNMPAADPNEEYSYEVLEQIANHLKAFSSVSPQVGIICGCGLCSLLEKINHAKSIEYSSIPSFPASTEPGNEGRLIFGCIEGVPVVAMHGRFHHYEGYSLKTITMPVRVMKLIGVKMLIVTNVAGGINPDYKVGDIMFVSDHLNMLGMAGNSPLRGPNDDRFGPRFPPLTNAYTPECLETAKTVTAEMGIADICHEGVYVGLGGPSYETIAELKALRTMGGDAVGMSTVHEVIVAAHCDLSVLAFSVITNKCSIDYAQKEVANHEEIVAASNERQATCGDFVVNFIRALSVP